jgi:small nuclear ribonucleoprotein (snRNP)-like protein
VSIAQRKFLAEVSSLLNKNVIVKTTTGKEYSGSLAGFNSENLNLCLAEAKDKEGNKIRRIFLNGNVVEEIFSVEEVFDLKGLSDRIEKVFPTMVKLYEDQGFMWVMNRVKVTKKGVVEGAGPAAERVKKVYEQFVSETKG